MASNINGCPRCHQVTHLPEGSVPGEPGGRWPLSDACFRGWEISSSCGAKTTEWRGDDCCVNSFAKVGSRCKSQYSSRRIPSSFQIIVYLLLFGRYREASKAKPLAVAFVTCYGKGTASDLVAQMVVERRPGVGKRWGLVDAGRKKRKVNDIDNIDLACETM